VIRHPARRGFLCAGHIVDHGAGGNDRVSPEPGEVLLDPVFLFGHSKANEQNIRLDVLNGKDNFPACGAVLLEVSVMEASNLQPREACVNVADCLSQDLFPAAEEKD